MIEREAYDKVAALMGADPEIMPHLGELFLDQTIINPILPETVKKLGRILDLRPGQTLLDLACGKGGVSLPLVHIYKVKLTGVDLMPDFIREAWSRAEYTGLYDLCRFELNDAADFASHTEKQWDAVFVLGSLPIIWPDLDEGLKKAAALVKSGGKLVIGLPYLKPDGEKDDEYPWLMTSEEMTRFLEQVGKVIETLDDGEDGWRVMVEEQDSAAERLKRLYGGNEKLTAFLDVWMSNYQWQIKNLGFALWVIQIP